MKRMWQNWLAIAALMTLSGTTMAQNGWNQPAEIGSYQSILARAGCDSNVGILGQGLAQPGIPMQGSAMHGGAMMQNGGGMVSSGAMMHGGDFGGAMMQNRAGIGASNATNSAVGNMQGAAMDAAQAIQGQSGYATGGASINGSTMGATTMGMNGSMGGFGSGVVTGSMGGQAIAMPQTSPVMSGMSVPAVGNSLMNGGQIGGSVMSAPVYSSDPVYSSAPVCSSGSIYSQVPQYDMSPVYQQSVVAPVFANGGGTRRQRSNYTASVTGLMFQRDYEDNRYLARNPSGGTLYTNDADEGTMDGYGVTIGSRNCTGGGFEVGYWALSPSRSVGTLTGANVATQIQGLDQLTHVSSGRDLYDIYANTVAQTIVRETDINNLEFNMLRNGGTFRTRGNRNGFYELLGGFRWFEFDEGLQYTASIDNGAFPLVPSDFFYNLEARNRLLGVQLGARNEYCLSSKLRLFSGVKGGIFNNNIRTVQNITDLNGEIAQVNSGTAAGRPFSYNDEKNDVAFLGELDFGVLYHLSCRTRVRLGYRMLGASGIALAADQMPYQYNDPDELLRANSNGNLLLGGGYYGLEFCF